MLHGAKMKVRQTLQFPGRESPLLRAYDFLCFLMKIKKCHWSAAILKSASLKKSIFWPQKLIFEVFWGHFWVICSFVPVSINASLHHCKGLKRQKCGFECDWQVAIYSRMIFWHKMKNRFFDLKNRFSKIFEVTFDSFWMPRLRKCSSSATSQVSNFFWDLKSKIRS